MHTGFRSAWNVEQSDGHGVYDVTLLRSVFQIGSVLLRGLASGTLGVLSCGAPFFADQVEDTLILFCARPMLQR